MKKFLLSIFCCLMAFASVQAEDLTATLSFANKAQRTSFSTSKQVWEQNGIKFTNNKSASTNAIADYAKPVRLYAGSNIVVECANMTKIVFECNSSSYATALKNSIGATATTSVSSDKVTVTFAEPCSSFTVAKLTAQVRMDALTVTCAAASGGDEPDTPTLALPAVSVADKSKIALGTNITITPAGGNTVTYSVGDVSKTITEATNITADKAGVMTLSITSTCGEESANVTYTYYVKPSKPEMVAEKEWFEDELEVSIVAAEGDIYYTLDGTIPTVDEGLMYEGSFVITATTTVMAIAVVDNVESDAETVTYAKMDPNAVSFKHVASELDYANGTAVESLTFGDVTATFGKGSNSNNAPKYYTTGAAIRAYGGNTITFTGAVGVTITGVELTFGSDDGSNEISADCGTFSTNTWTGASNEVKLTIGGSTGHRRIAAIKVTYSINENVVVIATPSITPSASFVGSKTVEITNNEEGTTLYYSTNGENYDAYTGALNITETTTVYAKAVDAQGNESAVAEATYTKIEVLSIAEAKAAYDAAKADVDVAVDLTGAVVTVNNGQYLFIENETSAINLYNSGEKYAVGTKFTSGYILGKSSQYNKMHQITGAEFKNVETTTVAVEPTEVEIADIKGNNAEWEGRFVKLSGVSINVGDKTIKQGEDTYALYNRFSLTLKDAAMCDVEGIVAIFNTTEQLYISKVTPFHTLSVSAAGWATLYLDFAAAIPAEVEAYTVTEVNNGYVTLTQVEGVLPANTGIIVKADEDDYNFVASTGAAADVTGNLLSGTTKDTVIESAAYVLGVKDGIVGLYTATTNGYAEGTFLNNANKAYLPKSAGMNAASYSFRFGEGITGINELKGENAEVKAIYDLTGRRVEAITAPGIYIVGGKKVLVK